MKSTTVYEWGEERIIQYNILKVTQTRFLSNLSQNLFQFLFSSGDITNYWNNILLLNFLFETNLNQWSTMDNKYDFTSSARFSSFFSFLAKA